MPYIPHTENDIQEMLAAIGAESVDQLFDEIPKALTKASLQQISEGLNEFEVSRLLQQRAPQMIPGYSFIGAGAYEHHIPAIVWEVARRGEYYTAYTPYQAEASQGSLQLIYEYQTMMANLMASDVANASMYDGATALAEAVLMAVRIKKGRAKRVLMPSNIHPHYQQVLTTVLQRQGILLETVSYCSEQGTLQVDELKNCNAEGLAALIIPQPNFFGGLEQVDALTDIAHQLEALVIALVNPIAMALCKPPGEWGQQGADIVCGEGQPLGVPLSGGGPYFGFMTCKKQYVRQMPGRIVGATEDQDGKRGFTLTLQAREQHIRRAKATSNICTNQGLMVTAASVYLSVMGAQGLRQVALKSHAQARGLYDRLLSVEGVEKVFAAPYFHEFVVRVNKPLFEVCQSLAQQGLQAGYALDTSFPELKNCLLVCATETKTKADLERYQQLMAKVLQN